MSKRFLGLLLCVGPALLACGRAADSPAGPNVVLVVIDTLRPDRLGCYGYERETSPVLDSMAEEFFLFENAQSPAPWTAPSLISLMTSAYPNVHGVHGFPVPGRLGSGFTTLAEILHRNGYDTAAFTEGGYAKGDFGLDRGFDLFPENPGDPEGYTSNLSHPSRLAANLDRTIEWLHADREEPFFLFFHTYEVHSPPRAPVEDVRTFRPDFDPALTEEAVQVAVDAWNERRELTAEGARAMRRYTLLLGRHMGAGHVSEIEDRPALRARSEELGLPLEFDAATQSPEDMTWVEDLYDAEIRFTDRHLGRLWTALEDEGLADDTILVLVSDHGEALGEHSRIGHGHELHDEVLRVLLMMRIPSLAQPPRRVSEPVRSVDVTPTLLELVGIDTAELPLQGRSLLPLLGGATDERTAFSQATMADGGLSGLRTVRTERWRLLLDPEQDRVELYDLLQDPGATRNVAAANPETVALLQERLASQDREDRRLRERLGEVTPTEVAPDSDLLQDLKGLGYTGEDE